MEEVGYLVVGVRYGVQLFRIIGLIKQSRELRQMQRMGDITLPDLDLADEIEGYYLHKDPKGIE